MYRHAFPINPLSISGRVSCPAAHVLSISVSEATIHLSEASLNTARLPTG